jgi:hypothetical protein
MAKCFRESRMREICQSGLTRGEATAHTVPLLLSFHFLCYLSYLVFISLREPARSFMSREVISFSVLNGNEFVPIIANGSFANQTPILQNLAKSASVF